MKAGAVTLVLICSALFPLAGHADSYAGEYRFGWTNDTYQTAGNLVIGVTDMGDNHYLVSGVIEKTTPPPTEFVPVHGNVEILQGQVHLTISFVSMSDVYVGTEMLRAVLEPGRLTGPFKGVGIYNGIENFEGSMWLLP